MLEDDLFAFTGPPHPPVLGNHPQMLKAVAPDNTIPLRSPLVGSKHSGYLPVCLKKAERLSFRGTLLPKSQNMGGGEEMDGAFFSSRLCSPAGFPMASDPERKVPLMERVCCVSKQLPERFPWGFNGAEGAICCPQHFGDH